MTAQVWRERAEAAEAECARLRASLVAATDAAEALLAQVEATALRVAARETRDAASLRSLMATDAAARAYLTAVDASHAAEAAWMNAKSGRYAAQSHALARPGAMRDARTALVKALDIQRFEK